MKKLLLALGVASSLSGCAAASTLAALGTASNPIATTGDKVVLSGTKALAVAYDAYAGIARSAKIAVEAGHFSADQLRMIQVLNNQAAKLMDGADTTLSFAERAAGLMLIVSQLHSILEV